MSDSENADRPSNATISRALRDIVISVYKAGNTDDLTVKRVRTRAEVELDLPVGFFKSNQTWKQKSHDIIHEAVEKYCSDEPAPAPERAAPPKKAPKPKPAPKKSEPVSDSPRGTKRKATVPAKKAQKRQKTIVSSDEESDAAQGDALSDADSEPPKKIARRPKKVVMEDSEDDENDAANRVTAKTQLDDSDGNGDEAGAGAAPTQNTKAIITENTPADVSESELSNLIDESPVKRKRQKKTAPKKSGKGSKSKETEVAKPKARASKSKDAQNDDPDQAEIKRLQGWLVKCGIRKIWSKELAGCDTAKEKIRHLKNMLRDAGMDGKYSNEKAARIKEQREFAKDLEAIQEGEKSWGKIDEPEGGGRPRRRAAMAPKQVVVRDPEDEEDEDDEEEGANDDDDDSDVTDDIKKDVLSGTSSESEDDSKDDSE